MREPKIQTCSVCDEPTDRCEDDSLYTVDGDGPLCESCYCKHKYEASGDADER